MKVDTGFDPAEKKIVITVQTPLLERHLPLFRELINNSGNNKGLPKGLGIEDIEGLKSDTVLVTFPIQDNDIKSSSELKKSSVIGIKMEYMESISTEINRFVSMALKRELESLEFIPLEGYPLESLKKDIQTAVKGKRNLCLIKTYDEYLNSLKNESKKDAFQFHQYMVWYGTDEYIDVAINLFNGELDELKKNYLEKLSFTNWI